MGCYVSHVKIRQKIEEQNEKISQLLILNQSLKNQLAELQQQEQQIPKKLDTKDRRIIDITSLAKEIEDQILSIEKLLEKLNKNSQYPQNELRNRLDELNQWGNLLDKIGQPDDKVSQEIQPEFQQNLSPDEDLKSDE